MAVSNELTFIPYGMDSLGTETRDITRSMIIKQKRFDRHCGGSNIRRTKGRRGKKLYFTGLEPTRKTQEDGKCLLLTTTTNKYNA